MTIEPTRQDTPDVMLDALFAAARAAPAPVPDALTARVLADAAAEMPRAARPAAAVRVVPAPGWLAALTGLLGGRSAVAGLAAAGLAGVWIGFAQPVPLPFDTGLSAGTVELYPADLDLWSEILNADPLSEG